MHVSRGVTCAKCTLYAGRTSPAVLTAYGSLVAAFSSSTPEAAKNVLRPFYFRRLYTNPPADI